MGHKGSCENENSDFLDLGWDLKFSISNNFPGGAGSAGPRPALWVRRLYGSGPQPRLYIQITREA